MQERARRRELRNAGVLAAREARQRLARAITTLDADPGDAPALQLAAELATAVGALYGCEIGEADGVLDRLRAASGVLSGVLARLHGPERGTKVDEAGALVAESLAVLYPVRAGLERELDHERGHAPTASVLAASEAAEVEAARVLAAQAPPSEPAPIDLTRPKSSRISVRPVPLIDSRLPPPVEALLHMAPDTDVSPGRVSLEAAALFPEAVGAATLTSPQPPGRVRRKALELMSDGAGELVDRSSGLAGASGDGAERRDASRVELAVDIGLYSATQFYAGLSNDISEGGVFVSTVRPLPVGSELTLSFVLPGGHAVTTRGRVAWLAAPRDDDSRPGMGVRFVRLEPQHRAAIDGFLRYRPAMLHEV